MRIRLLLLATMPVCSLCAQGLGSPRLGWMPDASGALRPLEGIAGAVTLGERAATDVLRAASSENWVLAQTAREILALPRLGAALARFPAPDGGALFAFDREGEPAAVCFPSAGRLLLWKDGRFEDAVWKPPGGVLALAATGPGALSFLVLREASVWRVDVSPAGEVSLPLPGVGPPALLRPDGTVVWGAGNTLFFRGSEGGVRQTGLPEAIHDLNQLTGDWIRARLADRQVAVRFPVGAPQVFELPEVSP